MQDQDGVDCVAVALAVDEHSIKFVVPELDLEHTVRTQELPTKYLWDQPGKKLLVWPEVPKATGQGRTRIERHRAAKAATRSKADKATSPNSSLAQLAESEEGDPMLNNDGAVAIGQLSIFQVRLNADFTAGLTPILKLQVLPATTTAATLARTCSAALCHTRSDV